MTTPAQEYVKDHPWLTDALHNEMQLAKALVECHRCDCIIVSIEELNDLGITYAFDTDQWLYKHRVIQNGY